jgi:hypothetical protein
VSAPVAVVHLVRHTNATAPFEAFLASYRRCRAGIEHDLVVLLKGFEDPAARARILERCADLRPGIVEVSDRGLDLTAYMAAAGVLDHDRLCFVNSFSEILAPDWLRALDAGLDGPGVGAAGASGSWASHRSLALSMLRLPNGYGGSLGDRARMGSALRSISTAPKLSRPRWAVRAATDISNDIAGYPGFPVAHLRTNAFLIGRRLLLSLKAGALASKRSNYRFESGHASLTAQLRARGLAAVVVGRDGVARGEDEWPDANVFWQGNQEQLLVADNQTRAYEQGDADVRDALSRYAWGPRARPG